MIGSTLTAWLASEGVVMTIGLFALVSLPQSQVPLGASYGSLQIPIPTRRRGWMLLCQWLVFGAPASWRILTDSGVRDGRDRGASGRVLLRKSGYRAGIPDRCVELH